MTESEKLSIFSAAAERKTYRYAAAQLRFEYHARGLQVKQADYELLEEIMQKRSKMNKDEPSDS